jgi:hypothetical protein
LYDWLSVIAMFEAVSVLPSPTTALVTMTTLIPESACAWWRLAASRRYCSRDCGDTAASSTILSPVPDVYVLERSAKTRVSAAAPQPRGAQLRAAQDSAHVPGSEAAQWVLISCRATGSSSGTIDGNALSTVATFSPLSG